MKSIFLIFVSTQYNSILNLLGTIPFLSVNVSLLFTYLSELQDWSLDFLIFWGYAKLTPRNIEKYTGNCKPNRMLHIGYFSFVNFFDHIGYFAKMTLKMFRIRNNFYGWHV